MNNKKNTLEKIEKLGVYYTPNGVAESLIRLVHSKYFHQNKEITVLEPSVGDGVFINALKKVYDNELIVTAIDIDSSVIHRLTESFCAESNFKFVSKDFIDFFIDNQEKKFDLIIGNPPFIRKHDYSSSFKSNLPKISKLCGYNQSHLKNSWACFVLASLFLLEDDGFFAFIVPYEILNVSYGIELQRKAISIVQRIDIYVPDEKAFGQLDQDAVAITGSKRSANPGIFIHRVDSLNTFKVRSQREVELTQNNSASSLELNGFLLKSSVIHKIKKIVSHTKRISDFCTSAPGIVTGANDFFILKKDDLTKYGLEEYSKKILKKGSFLPKGPIFKENHFDVIEKKEAAYFLDFNATPTDELSASAIAYIKQGELLGYNTGYKCSRRQRWYDVPCFPSTEGMFFKRSHAYPRICINEAQVLVTDTAYRIKVHEGFTMRGLCFSFYNPLTLLFSEINGRFYGGGVLELTPSEFKDLPLIYHEPTDIEFSEFEDIHNGSDNVLKDLLYFGSKWMKDAIRISQDDIDDIIEALQIIKAHRLRHGTSITATDLF